MVFVEGPIQEIQYPRKAGFSTNYDGNAMATNFERDECVSFAVSTKIGTNDSKAIHSMKEKLRGKLTFIIQPNSLAFSINYFHHASI